MQRLSDEESFAGPQTDSLKNRIQFAISVENELAIDEVAIPFLEVCISRWTLDASSHCR